MDLNEFERKKKKYTTSLVKGVIFKDDYKYSAFIAITFDLDDSNKRKLMGFQVQK